MNQRNTEDSIRQIIYTQTDHIFCPPDSQWIHCRSTYYITHSNECGPRTLLVMHIMALYPHPHANMLLPITDTNIAQISRTWIASSLVLGHPFHESLASTFLLKSFDDTRHSSTATSDPYDIIPWESSTNGTDIFPNEYSISYNENQSYHEFTASSQTGDTSEHIENSRHLEAQNRIAYMTHDTRRIPQTINHQEQANNTRLNVGIQRKITDWTSHRPFPSGTGAEDTNTIPDESIPNGSFPPQIDPTRTLRVIMQNPQYSLQLTNENFTSIQLTQRSKELSTAIFTAISPNKNWHNPSHWTQFKHPFKRVFKQIHITATSSDVGKLSHYITNTNLTGGSVILIFDQWASKVSSTSTDPRGHGTYAVTTLQGRNGKYLSIIAAYISVLKGTKAGVNTVHSQQKYLMEIAAIKDNKLPSASTCPRKEAIKALSSLISDLQQRDHAIILAIDANQTVLECKNSSGIKHHTIEWLRHTSSRNPPDFYHYCSK
jgi:hypothetical protein